ncbi:MAG: GMC family oxidoreductase [Pseudomonadota bacterium]
MLAAGGIENARLLLLSRHQRPAGLGNGNDLVGRFFQEHASTDSGYLATDLPLRRKGIYARPQWRDGVGYRVHLALSPAAEEKHQLPAFRAELTPVAVVGYAARSVRAGDVTAQDVAVLFEQRDAITARYACGIKPDRMGLILSNYGQLLPEPENRVILSDRRDPFGRQLPALMLRITKADHDGLYRAHRLIARDVARLGIGRMRIELPEITDDPMPDRAWGAQHIGTTRMAVAPSAGVVDEDARVHETANLYVAGSSIFPTCGWQNPTLTIVATKLKLATHLKQRIGAG